MRPARVAEIETCLVAALTKANTVYEKISGEWVTERGVESFLGMFLAQSFWKQDNLAESNWGVRPEVTIAEFERKYAPHVSVRGRRSKERNRRNRLDFVFLEEMGKDTYVARSIVELKRDTEVEWFNDIYRVAKLVRKYGANECLHWGAFLGIAPEKRGHEWIGRSDAWPRYKKRIDVLATKEDVRVHHIKRRKLPFKKANNDWRLEIVGAIFYPRLNRAKRVPA